MTMITETRSTRIGFADRLAAFAAAFGDMRRKRLTMYELGGLDEHTLRDIGLDRADVVDARRMSNAADQVQLLVRARMRNTG